MTLRALIIDDEPLARDGLRDFLEAEDGVDVVGECRNGREAVEALEAEDVDLVFLDVQMPELDGFDVLGSLDEDRIPAVVFVTAYDEYALEAFEVHAVDYLLKPVKKERFQEAVARARERSEAAEVSSMQERIRSLLADVREERSGPSRRILIKSGSRSSFLRTDQIDWIEAAGNYATLHTRSGSHMIRSTMKALEAKLDSDTFVRIHRSYIVNLDRVKEIQPWFKGDHLVILRDGTELSFTRKYRAILEEERGWSI